MTVLTSPRTTATLSCPRFAGDPQLQAVLAGRLRLAAVGTRPYPAPVLSAGPSIRKVQGALRDVYGYVTETNGHFGPLTGRAVADFKRRRKISPSDPVVGPVTLAALERECRRQTSTVDDWLGIPLSGWASPLTTSGVTVQTSGQEAFAAFADALARCKSDRAIVVVSGWDFHESTLLRPSHTVGAALAAAAGRGAKVRALLSRTPALRLPGGQVWRAPGPDNTGAVAFFNRLPGGAALHDGLVLHHVIPGRVLPLLGPVQLGMHHQKAWVVFDGNRLTAWIGGIDINPNRTPLGGRPVGDVLHDVQAQLDGPAAAHVYELLRARWNTHPDTPSASRLPPVPTPTTAAGTQRARIITSFGDPTRFAGLGPGPGGGRLPAYPFAPTGSKSYREMVFHCIAKARDFIYLEDQYLVDEEVGRRLAAAMPNLNALIIVICDSNAVNGELHQAWERRRRVLAPLARFAGKVAVVRGNRFIHAKTWIFDDVVSIVGSANVNRRGFQHDSEAAVAFGDLTKTGSVRTLRTRLWRQHLGAAAPALSTPVATSLRVWKSPPVGSNVVTYDPRGGVDGEPVDNRLRFIFTTDEFWDIVDPACP